MLSFRTDWSGISLITLWWSCRGRGTGGYVATDRDRRRGEAAVAEIAGDPLWDSHHSAELWSHSPWGTRSLRCSKPSTLIGSVTSSRTPELPHLESDGHR